MLPQLERHTGARGLVGSSAEHDECRIARNLEALGVGDRTIGVEAYGPWNDLVARLVTAFTSRIHTTTRSLRRCIDRTSSVVVNAAKSPGVAIRSTACLGGSGGLSLGMRGSRSTGDSPCSTTENRTTRQQTGSSRSLPGTPANIGSSTRSSELSPRGPNHAINPRSRHESGVAASAGSKASGRSNRTESVKSQGRRTEDCESRPDERRAEQHEREEQRHLGRRLPVFEEAITKVHVERRDGQARRERREKAASVKGFGRRVGEERHAERIDGFVFPPHADAAPNQVQRRDGREPDADACGGAQHEHRHGHADPLRPGGPVGPGGQYPGADDRHGDQHDRQQDDVVEAALEPERLPNGRAEAGPPQESAEDDGIGRREGRAENDCERQRQGQQPPRREW